MIDDLLPGLDAAPNIHPMFVHFPIALWVLALGFWGWSVARGRDDLFTVGRWILNVGTASALVAVATGWLGADQLGHESAGHDSVHTHRNFMLVATGAATLLTLAAHLWRAKVSAAGRLALLVSLAAVNGIGALGADRGVVIVYGAETTHAEHDHSGEM